MPRPKSSGSERAFPHNLEVERALLGSILLDNTALSVALEHINKDDFFSDAHRITFEKMTGISEKNRTIDLLTLSEEFSKEGLLEKAGGPAYLAALTDGVPAGSTASVTEYSRIVKEKSLIRRLINASNNVIARCLEATDDPEALLDGAYSQLSEVSLRVQGGGLTDIGSILKSSFGDLEAAFCGPHHRSGVETGLTGLDDLLGGLHPGELVVLAGRPSLGKTALMLNIACHAALDRQTRVAIFSLETTEQALVTRMLCAEARVDGHRLRTGFLGRDDWTKLLRALGRIAGAPISIDDSSSLTPGQLHRRAKRRQQHKGLDLICVDYLQLIDPGVKKSNRVEEITYISNMLKATAKDLGVPVLALSQLSRAPEIRTSHRPRLSDLRESGSIEQDADTVLFIYQPGMYRRGERDDGSGAEVEIIIGKQRNGPTGYVKAVFLKPFTRFENWAPPSAEPEAGSPGEWTPYKDG